MNINDFIRNLTCYDSQAVDKLEYYATHDSKLCIEIVKALLLSEELADDPSLCSFAVQQIVKAWKPSQFAEWIITSWSSLSWLPRRKVLYCLGDVQAITISTDTALTLFHHVTSSVNERHLIVAGLCLSAKIRNCVPLLYELIPQIGHYDDPDRQRSLEDFISGVYRSYGQPS